MDDPPLQKIAISGPTLASLIQRFTTARSAVDGLLFGHVTHVNPHNLSDDSATSADSPTLVATVTGFLCSSSFHDSSGAVQLDSLCRLLHHHSSFLGWFSGRQKTSLRPSMREFSVTKSLSSLSQFSSPIRNAPESSGFSPCVFLLLASPPSDHTGHVHTHEYRSYQFRMGAQSFDPKSLDIVNIGPDFRGHYGSFIPNSPFPAIDCELQGIPVKEDSGDRLSRMKQVSKYQKELDECAEGFEIGRLSRLIGSGANTYTDVLEDLYEKMIVKVETLTRSVEKTSARVLELENHNRKLKNNIFRSSASE